MLLIEATCPDSSFGSTSVDLPIALRAAHLHQLPAFGLQFHSQRLALLPKEGIWLTDVDCPLSLRFCMPTNVKVAEYHIMLHIRVKMRGNCTGTTSSCPNWLETMHTPSRLLCLYPRGLHVCTDGDHCLTLRQAWKAAAIQRNFNRSIQECSGLCLSSII